MGGGGLVRDDFATDLAELPKVPEDGLFCNLDLQDKSARTLVLVGKTGNGKSATGNTILGYNKFLSKGSGKCVTKQCEIGGRKLPDGVKLNVIDTPGLYSPSSKSEFTIRAIVNCLRLARNGIDAVLLVFSARNRLTEEEQSILRTLKTIFGSNIVDYMIVVFTNGDAFEDGESLDEFLQDSDFQGILEECDDRKVLFDNKLPESKKEEQVRNLFDLVEKISENNNGKPYMADLSLELRDNEVSFQEERKKIEAKKGLSSKKEISQLMKELKKSNKEMLKGVEDKVSNQLKESLKDVKEQLAKAQTAREETEKKMKQEMKENQKLSSDEINKLREQLEKAEKETASLRSQLDSKKCYVL